ncbi:MAG: PKD-like family lipoprotein [Chitinophagaceae bacterium]
MKNIISALFIGCAMLMAGCKKDKGNYDYTTVPMAVIDTAGIGQPRYLERSQLLDIDPVIRYEGGNINALKYQWLIYPYVVGSAATTPSKVISNEKRLNVPIGEKVGEYRLELVVTDTTNLLKSNTVFSVVVSAGIEYGWIVLHGNSEGSDVDFMVTANAVPVAGITPKRLRNMYSANVGEKIPGTPRFIAQNRRTNSLANWITIASSEQFSRMSGADFSLVRENAAFFRRSDEVIDPQAYLLTSSSNDALINNKRLYLFNTTYETDARFGTSVPGDYELAPFMAYMVGFNYPVVVYDQKNGRFARPASTFGAMIDFNAPANPATAAFDLRSIGMDMLFMDRGFSSYTHAFFKSRTGNAYWLYIANFNSSDNGQLAVAKYDMSALPEIASAKFFQTSELGYVDWYATEDKIYAYDFQTTNTAKVVFSGFPAGEKITSMKVYKPRPNFNLSTVEGRLMYVATWNGTEGKVYEFALNGISGEITATPLNTFTGMGKVADMTAKARGSGTY